MTDDELNLAARRDPTATTTAQTRTTIVNGLGSYQQTTSSPRSRISIKTTRRATTTPVTTRASTTTTNTPCDGISGQHSSYLKDNLDIVRQKCGEFHACTVELYKSENLHRILAGDNIQLRNICGLLYQNANGRYRVLDNQCSTQARESIKEILGDEELSPLLEGSFHGDDSWGKLKTCLDNTPGDSTYLDKLCRLKGNSTAPLCNSTDVQVTTETFFNTKLRQYHCTCNTFTEQSADPLPLRRLIGAVCGVSLISLLIVVIVVLCLRQRKLKRRQQSPNARQTQHRRQMRLVVVTRASAITLRYPNVTSLTAVRRPPAAATTTTWSCCQTWPVCTTRSSYLNILQLSASSLLHKTVSTSWPSTWRHLPPPTGRRGPLKDLTGRWRKPRTSIRSTSSP